MTMNFEEIKKHHLNIWTLIKCILDDYPEHRRYIEEGILSHRKDDLIVLDRLAKSVLEIANGNSVTLKNLASGYRWMCESFTKEELYFRRNGTYRCKSLNQAIEETYSNKEIMKKYMDGLLISQVLWSNHFRVFLYFTSRFLSKLPNHFNYLEIGCGHGLYICEAARHKNSKKLTGWDISSQSIMHTSRVLEQFNLNKKVTLEQQDIYDKRPDNVFDALVLGEILEHLETPDIALKNLANQLKSGGMVFINFPINSPAPDHIYLLKTIEEVVSLVRNAGYKVLETEAFPMTGYNIERAISSKVTISVVVIAEK